MTDLPFAFVFILESPAPTDLYEGRYEGRALCESLALAGHPHSYRLVTNLEQLKRALSMDAADAGIAAEGLRFKRPPVLHLSMHGNSDGVQLTDGTFVNWDELRTLLDPINDYLPDGILLSMSSCEGYSAVRMSMQIGDEKPLFAVVGAAEAVNWADSLVGFTAFYHHLFKTFDVAKATEAWRYAAGDDRFFHRFGPETKASYLEYYSRRKAQELFGGQGILNAAPAAGGLNPTTHIDGPGLFGRGLGS